MKHVVKPFVCVLITMSLLFCLCSCGKDTSGLGQLDIGTTAGDEGTLAPLGGSDAKGSEPTSEPTPEPVPDSTPEPTPEPDNNPGDGKQFVVDEYSCDCFDCFIPQGWNVDYRVVDDGSGTMRIYVFVQDPTDPNNIIFFVSAMEPFFTSASDKKAAVSVLGSTYEWSPVMNELSAAGLLEQWSSLYTLMDATGFSDGVKYFKNYSIVSILDSTIAQGSDVDETASQVIAEVKIPNASQNYGILYSNDFVRFQFPYVNAVGYISYSNRGFVLSADRFSAEAEGLAYCAASFDFTKFNNKYGNGSGFTADEGVVINPGITLPDTKSFFDE